MSGEIVDLKDITPVVPPAKAAKKVPETKPEGFDLEQRLAEMEARLRQSIENELRSKIEAEVRAEVVMSPPSEVSRFETQDIDSLDEAPYVHVVPAEGEVVVHFVDDGVTIGSKVYYRGQEYAGNPEQEPWLNFTRQAQIRRFGNQKWVRGPWPYGGIDLTDPELSPEDKARLVSLSRR